MERSDAERGYPLVTMLVLPRRRPGHGAAFASHLAQVEAQRRPPSCGFRVGRSPFSGLDNGELDGARYSLVEAPSGCNAASIDG